MTGQRKTNQSATKEVKTGECDRNKVTKRQERRCQEWTKHKKKGQTKRQIVK